MVSAVVAVTAVGGAMVACVCSTARSDNYTAIYFGSFSPKPQKAFNRTHLTTSVML